MQQKNFNLSALAERLGKEGRKHELVGKIETAVHIRSVEVDLEIALEACNALEKSLDAPPQHSEAFRETTEAALLAYVVVLYARATKSRSNVRPTYDIRSRLSPQEKDVHAELCDLRDKAIAHFGSGGSYSGSWKVELAILNVVGRDVRSAVTTRRLIVDRGLLHRARDQILRALEIVGPVRGERINGFIEALNAEFAADPEFANEVQQHSLNLELLVGGPEQAARMMEGRTTGGRARGSFGHA